MGRTRFGFCRIAKSIIPFSSRNWSRLLEEIVLFRAKKTLDWSKFVLVLWLYTVSEYYLTGNYIGVMCDGQTVCASQSQRWVVVPLMTKGYPLLSPTPWLLHLLLMVQKVVLYISFIWIICFKIVLHVSPPVKFAQVVHYRTMLLLTFCFLF